MNVYEENINNITEYFIEGCRPDSAFGLGIEIEHFVFDSNNHSAEYEDIVRILRSVMTDADIPYCPEGHLIGFYNDRYSISLEPAAQLEISINPCRTCHELEEIYNSFRARLDSVLSGFGMRLECFGYNPYEKAENLKLIPKKRYEYMDRYFNNTGSLGRNMMRATASVQVSVDFSDERDAVRKYQLACALSPVFSFIMDNSPVFEGEPYDRHMARAYVWNDVDPARCMIMDGCFSQEFGFAKYAEYIMNMPAILITDGKNVIFTKDKKIKEIYADKLMTRREIEHILSMAFFDVRLKNYIEIRMADSCGIGRAIDYVRLIRNIFYDRECMQKLESYIGVVTNESVAQAKLSLIKNGYEGMIYKRPASEMINYVIACAGAGNSFDSHRGSLI